MAAHPSRSVKYNGEGRDDQGAMLDQLAREQLKQKLYLTVRLFYVALQQAGSVQVEKILFLTLSMHGGSCLHKDHHLGHFELARYHCVFMCFVFQPLAPWPGVSLPRPGGGCDDLERAPGSLSWHVSEWRCGLSPEVRRQALLSRMSTLCCGLPAWWKCKNILLALSWPCRESFLVCPVGIC